MDRRRFAAAAAGMALTPFAAARARERLRVPALDASYEYYCPELVEVTAPGKAVQPDGSALCSWSRRPYLEPNLEDARFASPGQMRLRMKKWDMYHLVTPEHYLSFLIAWIGYGAFASAWVYDRGARSGRDGISIRGAAPEVPMMRASSAGVSEFISRKLAMRFEVSGEDRRITVDFPGFADQGLHADIVLHLPAETEIICATHLTKPGRMHVNHKINNMTAAGELRLGGRSYSLSPETSFGMLDWSRGYPPRKQFWYWAVSTGRLPDGRIIGFNLGHGNFAAQQNENAVFTGRELTKIGVTVCEVPADDIMKPWRVYTPDRGLDLVFTPEFVRNSTLDLGVAYTIGQNALGTFTGRARLAAGETAEIKDMFGLYEWCDQKW